MLLFTTTLTGAEVEEAFIYRSSLYCWTYGGALRVYEVEDIEQAAERAAGELGLAASYVAFHSRGLGATPAQRQAIDDVRRHASDDQFHIDIDASSVRHWEQHVGLDTGSILDLLLYYDRMHLATDAGLFSFDEVDATGQGERRLEASLRIRESCFAVGGGLGTIVASCGEAGLSLLPHAHSREWLEARPQKVSESSLRADVGYGAVVNYTSRSEYEFLLAEFAPNAKSRDIERVTRATLSSSPQVQRELGSSQSADFVLWDQSRLVTFQDGRALSTSVIGSGGGERVLNRSRVISEYTTGGRPVLSAHRVGRGFVLELEDRLLLLGDDDHAIAQSGPVVSIRSYQSSKRYLRLVSLTGRNGIGLLGVDLGPSIW